MKRLLSIVFLAGYILSATECEQFLRLPLLVEHFMEHQTQVSELTFWEFLVMHYETDVPHDDQDMKLPFKECSHSSSITALAPTVHKIALKEGAHPEKSYSSYYSMHFTSLLGAEIFQPPRL